MGLPAERTKKMGEDDVVRQTFSVAGERFNRSPSGASDESGQVNGLISTGQLTGYPAYTPGLSTLWSTTSLVGIPGLGAGFTLRCFQRLSYRHIATQRWA